MTEKTENYEFGVEIKKILKLMIHSLYTNKDVAIRELISNASDACDKIRYKATQDDTLWENDKELKIKIEIDKEKRTLSIIDNGIGMDKKELISQLGTIAKSGTEAFLKNLSNDDTKNMQLIGQFGVGFYSSFMIADKVGVISKKAGAKKSYLWESEGEGKYTIQEVKEEHLRGTTIILYLKKEQDEFLDKIYLGNIIKLYSDHISVPVELKMDTGEYKTMNSASALWTRNKADITLEQYQEFYTHTSHLPGEPYLTLHNKAEGVIEFINLVFVPNKKPMDLYLPDRETKIKLYVKKVFITDTGVQILPSFLRFVRGVVDSEDLPLNINRESLQYNNMVEKIKKSLTKRILSELEKKVHDDDYAGFWENFGPVVKEGLCEGTVYSEEIFNICKFHSSKSIDKMTTLKEYIERMKPNQNNIFYITGDNINALDNSPQIEGFKEKDIEILYLTDIVDNFWVTVQSNFKSKDFKSITKGEIDLEDINGEKELNTAEPEKEIKFDDEKKEEEKLKNITNNDYEGLIVFIKDTLKDKIKDVKISKKLTSSPVCLTADKDAMDIRLERYLLDQNQIPKSMQKNLEINVKHSIIQRLNNELANEEEAKEIVEILFGEACVLEGEPVANPGEFIRKLNKLLEK
ncbi:MAG: molecular chaperone HtpG [Rickettsiales bacterium]|jgi:molecular chaperone HtpG|nr:molecular chaperone HtpG [Rickettsiales bacterium]